jgi:hypothetical protein
MPQIFVSYAREDEGVARRLRIDLERHALATWFDKDSILPGQNWAAEISDAISASSHFLALISKHSLTKRGFVQKELRLALDALDEIPPNQIFLIPVRIHDVRPAHRRLSALQWVDLWPSYDEAVRRIVLAVTGLSSSIDRDTCIQILESIDTDRLLKDGSDSAVKELTKRLLFHIIRKIFYFPFPNYHQFIDWLRSQGYRIPADLTFQSADLYNRALLKVEQLNRRRITVDEVEVALLFSQKRPFEALDK